MKTERKKRRKNVDDVAFNDVRLPCAQACNNYKGPSLLGAEAFQDGNLGTTPSYVALLRSHQELQVFEFKSPSAHTPTEGNFYFLELSSLIRHFFVLRSFN